MVDNSKKRTLFRRVVLKDNTAYYRFLSKFTLVDLTNPEEYIHSKKKSSQIHI